MQYIWVGGYGSPNQISHHPVSTMSVNCSLGRNAQFYDTTLPGGTYSKWDYYRTEFSGDTRDQAHYRDVYLSIRERFGSHYYEHKQPATGIRRIWYLL